MPIEKQVNVIREAVTERVGEKQLGGRAEETAGHQLGDIDFGRGICRSDIITPLNNPSEK
jgi:hypothetical protein